MGTFTPYNPPKLRNRPAPGTILVCYMDGHAPCFVGDGIVVPHPAGGFVFGVIEGSALPGDPPRATYRVGFGDVSLPTPWWEHNSTIERLPQNTLLLRRAVLTDDEAHALYPLMGRAWPTIDAAMADLMAIVPEKA